MSGDRARGAVEPEARRASAPDPPHVGEVRPAELLSLGVGAAAFGLGILGLYGRTEWLWIAGAFAALLFSATWARRTLNDPATVANDLVVATLLFGFAVLPLVPQSEPSEGHD